MEDINKNASQENKNSLEINKIKLFLENLTEEQEARHSKSIQEILSHIQKNDDLIYKLNNPEKIKWHKDPTVIIAGIALIISLLSFFYTIINDSSSHKMQEEIRNEEKANRKEDKTEAMVAEFESIMNQVATQYTAVLQQGDIQNNKNAAAPLSLAFTADMNRSLRRAFAIYKEIPNKITPIQKITLSSYLMQNSIIDGTEELYNDAIQSANSFEEKVTAYVNRGGYYANLNNENFMRDSFNNALSYINSAKGMEEKLILTQKIHVLSSLGLAEGMLKNCKESQAALDEASQVVSNQPELLFVGPISKINAIKNALHNSCPNLK